MPKPSTARKKFWADAMNRYHESLPGSEAERYLEDERGLSLAQVAPYRLGYVAEPLPGHEMYTGMLAIPYIKGSRATGGVVVTMRFRCVKDDGICDHSRHGGKYLSPEGETPRLYNTICLTENDDVVGISEGEIDAITATVCGLPTVGVPGVESWKPHMAPLFYGYETVYVLCDGDRTRYIEGCVLCKGGQCKGHNPGRQFGKKLARTLPNAHIVMMPGPDESRENGYDVNNVYTDFGKGAFLRMIR